MMLAEWNDSFSVGIPAIDDQHKVLFSLINKLSEGILNKRGRPVLGAVLGEVTAYAATHFKSEEEIMLKSAYPAFDEHKREHDRMTGKLAAFKERYDAGVEDISLEVLMELIDWLHEHMGASDSRIKPFISSRGVL